MNEFKEVFYLQDNEICKADIIDSSIRYFVAESKHGRFLIHRESLIDNSSIGERIFFTRKENLVNIKKSINQTFSELKQAVKIRYDIETEHLSYLISKQLNLAKNRVKPDFETMTLKEIMDKLTEEYHELKFEINSKEQDRDNILHEMADVGACLVGLLAKLMNEGDT